MNLEKSEFMLVIDSTNGLALWDEESDPVKNQALTVKDQILLNVEDSIAIDHLDEKWEIDAKALLAKMENADESEYKELWKNINDFWKRNDRETAGNE